MFPRPVLVGLSVAFLHIVKGSNGNSVELDKAIGTAVVTYLSFSVENCPWWANFAYWPDISASVKMCAKIWVNYMTTKFNAIADV